MFSTWLVGEWVSEKAKEAILHHSAASTALLMTGIFGPLAQNLAAESELRPEARNALDSWHKSAAARAHIIATWIRRTDGAIVYAYSGPGAHAHGGSLQWPPPAANDVAAATLIEPASPGREPAMLAFFAPIREDVSGRVIAIAEIHRLAGGLESDLRAVRLESFIAAGLLMTAITGLLLALRSGRQVIAAQRSALRRQRGEIARLHGINRKLRLKLKELHRTVAARQENFLRQVEADLHDGPAQHIAFAVLAVETLRPVLAAAKIESAEFEKLRFALQQAHQEIRNAMRGTFLPFELEDATATEAIELAVRHHERRTATKVSCAIGDMPEYVPLQMQQCIYRFVQEGLTNAFRHAAGKDQQVRIHCDGDSINMEVAYKGPDCSKERMQAGAGLGLICLRSRVESLGGTFLIESDPEAGARLKSTLFIANTGGRFGYSDSRRHH